MISIFPIDCSYTSFNQIQPYLDNGIVQINGQCVGTVIEYAPGEFGLVAAINTRQYNVRDFSDICFKARDYERVIDLEPVIVCQRTNLIILKAKNPVDAEEFNQGKAISLTNRFVLEDADKIKFYQKDLFSFKDVVTVIKAKRFCFNNYFGFFLSQEIHQERDLTSGGPIMNSKGELIGIKLPQVEQIISAFHIQYLCQQISSSNYQLMNNYPVLPLDLVNINSKNKHLYLPETASAEGHEFGSLIQDCPDHDDFPLKRGDLIVAIDDKRVRMQHIQDDPQFGDVNIDASALLSTNDYLHLTIYRDKQKLEIDVSKELLSRHWTRMRSNLNYIIMNAVVFQSYNSHLQALLLARSKLPNSTTLDPDSVHSLKKSKAYIKHDEDEVVIVSEKLTNDALFSAAGTPMSVSVSFPFVVRELNGQRIRNLKSLIELMSNIPVGSPFILSGSMNDINCSSTGIKLASANNEAILAHRKIKISNSCSPSLKTLEASYQSMEMGVSSEHHPGESSSDGLMRLAKPLYRYNWPKASAASSSSIDTIEDEDSQRFNIKQAERRGLLFLHCTIQSISPLKPYQYVPDKAASGTGFLIKYNGENYIVTCAHVLGCTIESSVRATFPEYSKDFELTPLIINNSHDLAILKVVPSQKEEFDALAYPFILETFPKIPAPQTGIIIMGFPGVSAGNKTNPKSQSGQAITAGYMTLQYHGQGLVIQTNAPTTGGNSGGPVIDSKTGYVLGIHSNGSANATLVNLARPAIFLAKMLKYLDEPVIPTCPQLPGIPFSLSGLTDPNLKIAYGLDPSCLAGARIDRLLAAIPELQVGDILVELIDKNQQIYLVDGKCNINLFGFDMLYRAFFEMHDIGDTIGFKIIRNGAELIVTTIIDPAWKLSSYICDSRKDLNKADFIKLSDKLVLATMDWEFLTPHKSKRYSFYHGIKLRKPGEGKESKVILLEMLPAALDEISLWMQTKDKLRFVNRINGMKITTIHDVESIIRLSTTNEFVFELESNLSIRKESLKIILDDETKAACVTASAASSSSSCSSSSSDDWRAAGLRYQ